MCEKTLAKLVLIVTNFVLFVAGGVLLGFGVAGAVNPEGLQKFLSHISNLNHVSNIVDIPSLITNSAKFMIVVGAIVFIFSFLGCAGAMCEIKWMLFLYWVSIVILIILEIALIIFAAVNPSMLKDETVKIMKDRWKEYKPERLYDNGTLQLPSDAISISWVAIQFKLGCCGITNFSDYNALTWNRSYVIEGETIIATVPPSCCVLESKDIPTSQLPDDYKKRLPECLNGIENINPVGCYEAVEGLIKQSNSISIIVCSVIILAELLAIACAVYLWRSSDSRKL